MGTSTLFAAEVVNGDDARFANFLILFISVLVNEFLTRGDIWYILCAMHIIGNEFWNDNYIYGKRFVTYKWQAIWYLPIYNDTAGGSKGGRWCKSTDQ